MTYRALIVVLAFFLGLIAGAALSYWFDRRVLMGITVSVGICGAIGWYAIAAWERGWKSKSHRRDRC